MNWGSILRTVICCVILIMLHYTVRPLLGWRAPIDFLVIAVLLVAVRMRPGLAAVLGFIIGLASDALTPSAFGSGALGMSVVAYLASWLKAVFFADNIALSAMFVFVGKWTFDALYLVSERRLQGPELVMQLLLWSPLAATVTALSGVLLLLLLRPLLGRSPG